MRKGGRWPLAFDAAPIPFQGYLNGFLIFVKTQRCIISESKETKEREQIGSERQTENELIDNREFRGALPERSAPLSNLARNTLRRN